MKTYLFVLTVAGAASVFSANAQTMMLPNSGFESWTAGNPDEWLTPNNPFIIVVTEGAGNGGGSAAHGIVLFDVEFNITLSGMLSSNEDGSGGFTVDDSYGFLLFDYKFTSVSGDQLTVAGTFMDVNDNLVGSGYSLFTATTANWTDGSMAITNTGDAVKGSVQFIITNTGGTAHPGSTFDIDNVRLSMNSTTAVAEASLPQVSVALNPNPTADQAVLSFKLVESSGIECVVTDHCGRAVNHYSMPQLAAGQHRFPIETSSFADGLYFVELRTASGNCITRLQVMR